MARRMLMAVVAVVCLGALAYAQVAREGNLPSDDPLNVGGTYEASFCAAESFMPSGVSTNNFYMRVTARFTRGWLEAEIAPRLKTNTTTLDGPAPRLRLNEAQFCWVQVAEASK